MRRLFLALLCMACSGSPADDNPGQAKSVYCTRDVAADTDPNSAFWRGASSVIAPNDTYGNPVGGHRTEVKSRWTNGNLYFLFVCPYQSFYLKPDPNSAVETDHLWRWDVAEVFIGSDFQNIRKYKEFEVSPQGEWVDLDIDLDRTETPYDVSWNSGMKAAARMDAAHRVWYAFLRIPYASVDSRPAAAGNPLRINFYRIQGPDRKAIAWRPTGKPAYHSPESFGTLRLSKLPLRRRASSPLE